MPYAFGDYILAHARLHTNPSDWIEKRPFENGLFSWLPLLGSKKVWCKNEKDNLD